MLRPVDTYLAYRQTSQWLSIQKNLFWSIFNCLEYLSFTPFIAESYRHKSPVDAPDLVQLVVFTFTISSDLAREASE